MRDFVFRGLFFRWVVLYIFRLWHTFGKTSLVWKIKEIYVRQCHPENTFSDNPTYCGPTSICTQVRIQKFFKEGLRRKIFKRKIFVYTRVSTHVHINNRQPCNSFSLLLFQIDCLLFSFFFFFFFFLKFFVSFFFFFFFFAFFFSSLFFFNFEGGGGAIPVTPL